VRQDQQSLNERGGSRISFRELNTADILLRIVETRGLEIAFLMWVSTERRAVRPILSTA
jgi:hypothetical protein